MTSLEEKVLSVIRANVEQKDALTLTSDLRNEAHLDSFGTLMVINSLEESFGITIEESDFGKVASVADVVALLRSKYHCPG